MGDRVEFFVPGPPVPKARARVVTTRGRTRAFTPDRTASWEARIAWRFRECFAGREPWPKDTCVGMLVEVIVSGKGPRASIRGDFDNFGKATSDALNTLAWHDDIQVVDARIIKRRARPRETPGIRVTLWRVED